MDVCSITLKFKIPALIWAHVKNSITSQNVWMLSPQDMRQCRCHGWILSLVDQMGVKTRPTSSHIHPYLFLDSHYFVTNLQKVPQPIFLPFGFLFLKNVMEHFEFQIRNYGKNPIEMTCHFFCNKINVN